MVRGVGDNRESGVQMNWETILPATLTVVLVVTAGLLGLQQGTVKTLRDTNQDLRDRRDDLEKENNLLEITASKLKAENDVLKSIVTGEVHWAALNDQLEAHHGQALTHWARVTQLLDKIVHVLEEKP